LAWRDSALREKPVNTSQLPDNPKPTVRLTELAGSGIPVLGSIRAIPSFQVEAPLELAVMLGSQEPMEDERFWCSALLTPLTARTTVG